MNNLHISLTSFKNESRVLKETRSLIKYNLIDHAFVAALHENTLLEKDIIDNNRIVYRLKLKSRNLSRGIISQLIKYTEYSYKIYKIFKDKNIEIITVHSFGLLPIGYILKNNFNAKLVYDAHELETETYNLKGIRKKLSKVVESIFIRKADLVIVVSNEIHKWYVNKYNINNVITVMNCPVNNENEARYNYFREQFNISDEVKIILYQGGIVGGRGVERLLKSFEEIKDNRFALIFLGYGNLVNLVQEYASKNKNIFYHQAVSPDVVLKYTSSADIGISYIDNDSLNDYYCLPNKLFEYISAGIAPLVNNVPEQRRVVEKYNIGVVMKELSGPALKDALDSIFKMNPIALKQNLTAAAEEYSWINQEKILIEGHRNHVI